MRLLAKNFSWVWRARTWELEIVGKSFACWNWLKDFFLETCLALLVSNSPSRMTIHSWRRIIFLKIYIFKIRQNRYNLTDGILFWMVKFKIHPHEQNTSAGFFSHLCLKMILLKWCQTEKKPAFSLILLSFSFHSKYIYDCFIYLNLWRF